ncbi:hypothetical protein IKN40_04475 [bacterium]|nr:hypothetical protein [bacterium]
MNSNITFIQEKLLTSLQRLDNEQDNIQSEIARSNAIAQLANTYIKSCNLIIRIEESKVNVNNKLKEVSIDEK